MAAVSFAAKTDVAVANINPEITMRLVTELPRSEVYDAHLFHADTLWVGRSRTTNAERHRIDAFVDGGERLLGSAFLPHTAGHVYPFGPGKVIVVGKSAEPWKTHYTVITRQGNNLQQATTTFPEQLQVEQFAGLPGAMFFTEVGDAAIYRHAPGRRGALKPKVSGPGAMVLTGDFLYIIERRSFQAGDESLLRINVKTELADRTYGSEPRNNLTHILSLPEHNLIAVSETDAHQVLLVNAKTNQPIVDVAIESGTPRGLAAAGQCLVVVSDESRRLSFVALNEPGYPVIAEWGLKDAGARLNQPRRVAVDPAKKRIYVRSTYGCPGCDVTNSSVFSFEEPSGETFRRCGIE